ncbi:hypothetical protein [Aerosakkonema funiforme]|uniref:hypothetical protein n=1 Tax=Aerosakkonema funiforme TaxID=1246630 RepID=UPI0035BAD211
MALFRGVLTCVGSARAMLAMSDVLTSVSRLIGKVFLKNFFTIPHTFVDRTCFYYPNCPKISQQVDK